MSTTDQEFSSRLLCYVNGNKVLEDKVDPEWTLLWYLRNKLGLVGTKLACGEGGCGACTVMLSKIVNGIVRHFSVNACLYPFASLHGVAVTTIEGLGSCKTQLHPLQERLAAAHGSQCGFCTPGFIMSAYALLRSQNGGPPSMEELEEALTGNLCRCTGYRPIFEAFRTFTDDPLPPCNQENCCRKNLTGNENEKLGEKFIGKPVLFDPSACAPYDPTQDLIFPPELKLNPSIGSECLLFRGPRVTFHQVNELQQLLKVKHEHPEAKIVVGNTEIGVEVRFKGQLYPVLVNVSNVPDLNQMEVTDSGLAVGAAVSLSNLKEKLKGLTNELPADRTEIFSALCEMLNWFAGKQIKNAACIGGNIMTCSPISDINPILLAAKAELTFQSQESGKRTVAIDSSFFTGYRKCDVGPTEVLQSVFIPFSCKGEYFRCYKQARRRDDDIAIVNAAFRVKVDLKSAQIEDASLAFGGVAATTVEAQKTAKTMVGKFWMGDSLVEDISSSLIEEISVDPSAPGGMVSYRNTLVPSFFLKFYKTVLEKLESNSVELGSHTTGNCDDSSHRSLVSSLPKRKATQFFQKVSPDQPLIDPIGKPMKHSTAAEQATGEAAYVDDIPQYRNELHAAVVLSSKARAKIIKIDTEKALEMPGVHRFVSEKDLPGDRNYINDLTGEAYVLGQRLREDIFSRDEVVWCGQQIGFIIAETPEQASEAAKMVKVTYEEVQPPIITIEDAIEAKSYMEPLPVSKGDVKNGMKESDFTQEGEVRIGGQEHFYMEPHTSLAVPKENGNIEVFSSTQSPTMLQNQISSALGIPSHKIVIKVKRLGGGFGGKETRTMIWGSPLALAASLIGRPVRLVLDRHSDMIMSGGRHPFLGRWKVGFTKEGQLKAIDMKLFSNCGYSADLSLGVMLKALFSADNSYKCENMLVTGYCCMTNLPSNTAFRGFGAPQAAFICETIVSQVANHLKKDIVDIRSRNFFKSGDSTYVGFKLERCTVLDCWNQVLEKSNFATRKLEIEQYNINNRHKKKGIAATTVQYGIGFPFPVLNQGGAYVMIYTDGSVLLTHGGVEMGQGLHIKMIQVASRALEIPMDLIHINETATDKIPNTSSTAASMGSDLYGDAVLDACLTLKKRIQPYKDADPQGGWKTWIGKAYFERVCLSAVGFFRKEGVIAWDFFSNKGCPYFYFTSGAAVTEVEIDCLSGDHTVLRTDIVMDVGDSLNPAIDIGQIEGAFVQGQGLFTLEELRYSPEGVLLTRGPGMYKIPGPGDIPREFNVSLLRDSPNPSTIYSSRAIGEPPLLLATSVFFALREAIVVARKESNPHDDSFFRLDSPLTAERIRMSCQDSITSKIPVAPQGSFKPWDITV